MGPYLEELGFKLVNTTKYLKGDIAVIQSYKRGHAAGHAQVYNGIIWISDFKQRTFYQGARSKKNETILQYI